MDATETTIGATPELFMFAPLIGVLAVLGSTIWHVYKSRKDGQPIGLGSIVWSILSIAILVFLSVMCSLKLVYTDTLYFLQCVVVISILGVVISRREFTFGKLGNLDQGNMPKKALSETIRLARDASLIFLGTEFARRALENPWNTSLDKIAPELVTVEFAVIACAAFLGYFLTRRRSIGPAIVFLACVLIGIIQHFVMAFRGTPILFVDLLSLSTAAEVSNGYIYTLDEGTIKAIMYAGLSLVCASFIRPARITSYRRVINDICTNIPFALVCALLVSYWIEVPDYREQYGTKIHYWNATVSYLEQGFLPTFLTSWQDIDIPVPEGYSKKGAEALTKEYAQKARELPGRTERRQAATEQFNKQKPSIVIVMNESFSDLSRLNNLNAGYEGPNFLKTGLDDALLRGQIGVSVYGGNTCNSEFEFLTGNSLSFVGVNRVPYNLYDFDQASNLARQLSQLGYQTSAVHPNTPDAWNRGKVYEQMGFENFYNTDNSFDGAERLHNGIADHCTYEKVLEILRNNKDPQFVFDVTIQNHGGYVGAGIPEDRIITLDTPFVDETYNQQLNTYISCIKASDEDLQWFVEELRNLDRPVILAFFGDHHPSFSDIYNDTIFADEDVDDVTHKARVYQTEYVIWANYDVAGARDSNQTYESSSWEQESSALTPTEQGCGTDILGTLVLDYAGAPLDDYQEAQLYVHETLPIICGVGYQDTSGAWHIPGTDPEHDAIYHDMSLMDHLRFGSQHTKGSDS